jgi:hypothetical protein
MKINIRYVLLVFYGGLFGSTGYLLMKNVSSRVDYYAVVFQVIILGVCGAGFTGTILSLGYAKKFNRIFLGVINVVFGLALANAISFGELRLMSLREMVLYGLLGLIDGVIISRWVKKYKSKKET